VDLTVRPQALVQAQANRDISHVAEHTTAILFLGTPHRGSNFGAWGWLAAQALRPLGSNPSILANLEYDSTSLLDLHRAFVGITRDDWHVYNFFEQRPTQIFRLWFLRWQQFVSSGPAWREYTDGRSSVFANHPLRMMGRKSEISASLSTIPD